MSEKNDAREWDESANHVIRLTSWVGNSPTSAALWLMGADLLDAPGQTWKGVGP